MSVETSYRTIIVVEMNKKINSNFYNETNKEAFLQIIKEFEDPAYQI